MYTTPVFRSRLGRIQTRTTGFDGFIWAFRDGRHKDCVSTARDMLFQRMLPGAIGVPPPRTQECTKRMIPILEHGTPMSKERWIGHPSIPLRVFLPGQYLVMLPIQMTKPKVTSKPLPVRSLTSKLVPLETQSNAEDCQWIKLTAGGNARRLAGADAALINNFMRWFQAISANMNVEAQKRALVASRKAASVFADVGGDVRRVEYSAEMAEIGFPA